MMVNVVDVFEWAKEHDYDFTQDRNSDFAETAASYGNLPALQSLRQNNCPWDARVVARARFRRHLEVLEWAIENGCPQEE